VPEQIIQIDICYKLKRNEVRIS